jgi:hypothetical protein
VQQLASTGTYLLMVEGRSSDTGTNAFRLSVQAVTDDASSLTLGQRIDGTIEHTGQTDRYSFTLGARTQVVFDALADSPLTWSLSGPRGQAITNRAIRASDSGQFGNNPVLDLVAGDYTLSVDGIRDATGAYAFRLLDLAQPLTGMSGSGTLSPGNETDIYRFDAQAGDRFRFDQQALAVPGPIWRLIGPYGDQLFFRSMSDFDASPVPSTGTYTLLIEGQPGATAANAYAFNIVKLDNTPPASPTGAPLTLGDRVSGTLTSPSQRDNYTFTLAADQWLIFDSQTNISITWSLTGPRGAEVTNRNLISTDSFEGPPVLQLVAGTYQLTIGGAGGGIGAYAFRLLDPALATELPLGAPNNGQLTPGNETDLYRFNANAGQRFYFDFQQFGLFDTAWRLLSPYGDQVFFSRIDSDQGPLALPLSGTYTLLIEGRFANIATNAYRFNVQPVSDDDAALALGARVDGTIAHTGQIDRYHFTLSQRALVAFDSLSTADFRWSLSGPRGVLVSDRSLRASDANNGKPVLDLAAGDYTLSIDGPGDVVGDYAFRVLDLSAGVPITPGEIVSGQLNPGNETKTYTFDANAGERMFFDFRQWTHTNTLWRLLSPYGDELFFSGIGADVQTLTLPVSGTYSLLIEGPYNETRVNSYRFLVQPVSDQTFAIVPGTAQQEQPAWTDGEVGGALHLRGLEWLEVPNSATVDLTGNLTIELWFKPAAFPVEWTPLLYKGNAAIQRGYSLWLNSAGFLYFSTGPSGSQLVQSLNGSVPTGTWYHAAAVVDRVNCQLRL